MIHEKHERRPRVRRYDANLGKIVEAASELVVPATIAAFACGGEGS